MSGAAYPTEDEIHGYVDDALDPARRAEIAGLLLGDGALAAQIAAYRADRDGLRLALADALLAPVPRAWHASIEAGTARPGLTRRAALVAGLGVAASAGVAVLLWPAGDALLADALAARAMQDGGAGSAELADAAGRTVRLGAALGLKLQAPDLARFGFRLARLDSVGARAAQLSYRDAQARRLTIYVRRSDGTVRFDLLRRGAVRVCVWQDEVVAAVIVAPMTAGEMMRVASAAYGALNL